MEEQGADKTETSGEEGVSGEGLAKGWWRDVGDERERGERERRREGREREGRRERKRERKVERPKRRQESRTGVEGRRG